MLMINCKEATLHTVERLT